MKIFNPLELAHVKKQVVDCRNWFDKKTASITFPVVVFHVRTTLFFSSKTLGNSKTTQCKKIEQIIF